MHHTLVFLGTFFIAIGALKLLYAIILRRIEKKP